MSLFAQVFRANRSCCLTSSRRFIGTHQHHLPTKTIQSHEKIASALFAANKFGAGSLSATSNFASAFNSSRIISNRRNMGSSTNPTSSPSPSPDKRVLSIQSHVVHGYVGNKSATFPLQILGFEVDAINSVQFSNHTGYAHIKGQILDETQLDDLVSGLEQNQLLDVYSHLLTGYIGNELFLRKVADTVKKLRAANPNLVYVCDPVMGDHGEMYVPETLLPIYQNEIIPLCDICTPNQYEVELLTGSKVCSVSDAWTAMQWFHEQGVKTVALSSTDLGPADGLLAFVSHKSGNDHTRLSITIPKQGNGINFTGTGDLFASLFLAHSTLSHDLKSAFENTIASLQSVIFNTIQRMPPHLIKVEARHRELKIVQSKRELEAPQVKLRAKFVQGGDDC